MKREMGAVSVDSASLCLYSLTEILLRKFVSNAYLRINSIAQMKFGLYHIRSVFNEFIGRDRYSQS